MVSVIMAMMVIMIIMVLPMVNSMVVVMVLGNGPEVPGSEAREAESL
jgi:hypothetical protein